MLAHLGHIPKNGESLDFECRRYIVAEMAGHRISRVRVEDLTVSGAERATELAAR
jgi:CBS domain containing-hemolysin-like protein